MITFHFHKMHGRFLNTIKSFNGCFTVHGWNCRNKGRKRAAAFRGWAALGWSDSFCAEIKISNVMCEFFTCLFKVISNVLFGWKSDPVTKFSWVKLSFGWKQNKQTNTWGKLDYETGIGIVVFWHNKNQQQTEDKNRNKQQKSCSVELRESRIASEVADSFILGSR